MTRLLPVVGGAIAPTVKGLSPKPGQLPEARGYPAPATGNSPIGGFVLEALSLLG